MLINEVAFTELNELAVEKAGSDVSLVKTVKLWCIQLLRGVARTPMDTTVHLRDR